MKWTKIIVLFCTIFLTSCYKEEILPINPEPKILDIFATNESKISDGQEVMFKSELATTYIIKLIDVSTNQVISKEKITSKIGENNLKIYTKSIQSKYLYLVLEDGNKKEINKTTLILN